MTLPEIGRYRLTSQQLLQPTITRCSDMVGWLGAVQAQEYAQTKWSLGLRLPHLNDQDVENDLTEGKILRTHLLRPTWHLVTSEDIRWMLQLTAPRVHATNAYMYRKLELNSAIFHRANKILVSSLHGQKQLTRNELNEEFKKNKIIAEGHRLSYIMMYAELAGIICSGARRGNQFTYALLDERVPAANLLDKEEALSRLALKYFSSRGPATIKDFSTWSGLTMTDCKKAVETATSNLTREVVENDEYHYASGVAFNKKASEHIYLLPLYDEFIMGYKDRSAILESRKKLHPVPPFRYDSMIVWDGQIIGTWKRTVIKNSIDIDGDFFTPMNNNQRKALDKAITGFANFTNMRVNFKDKNKPGP